MFKIQKACQQRLPLKIALVGVSNSGKSRSALRMADGLRAKLGDDAKICVIDSERGRSNLYARHHDYDVLDLDGDHSPQAYMKAIDAVEKEGYQICIIDSFSHAWNGNGGVLEIVEKAAAQSRSGNTYTAWGKGTPLQNNLIEKIMHSPLHIICTLRSKSETVLELDSRGKQVPRVVGTKAVQRNDIEYEFLVVMELDKTDHSATVYKDNTEVFQKESAFLITEETGHKLYDWHIKGAPVEIKSKKIEIELATHEQVNHLRALIKCKQAPAVLTDKWLEAAHVIAFEEMSSETIQKCIDKFTDEDFIKKIESFNQKHAA